MLSDVVIANNSYMKLDVLASQNIDQIALEVMKQDCPDFLLPVKTMERDGNTEMRYELSGGVRLKYMNQKMPKKDFIALIIGLLTPFKICNDWFLDYHNLYLNEQNIFVSRDYQQAKYVYIPVAEYKLFENLLSYCEGRTMIFISHRLSSAVLADKIIYMEKGKATEIGTHSELMKKGGGYAELFSKQAENYRDSCEGSENNE